MLDGLVRHYGGVRAVDGISLSVAEGEAVGLVGPNGAGKTSLLDLACGLERPTAGRVLLSGEDITTLSPEGRAARGLVRTFQETVLFPTLTVLEVVALGLERRRPTRLLPAAGGWPRAERAKQARARELVAALGLEPFADNPVHTLSAGTRRVAELACVLALEPRVLLLDEPSGGLAQPEAEALAALLARVHVELGAAMVVIEHDLRLVAGLTDRIVVIAAGRVVADGPAAAVISGWAGRESPGRESSVQAARGVPIGSLVAERTP
jgi:ABC-type branched-subunit amino acid transport system ATPase component